MAAVTVSGRVRTPASIDELERRWTAVRSAMEAGGIDVLYLESNNDFHGGYVRYLSDVAATRGKRTAVIFPLERPMTLVLHGPFGGDRSPAADGPLRGIERVLTTAAFPGVHYTGKYEVELAVEALSPYATARIGLVAPQQMSYATVEHLKGSLPQATFVEASDLVDAVKSIKSQEEVALLRRAAAIQDAALAKAVEAIEPGRSDYEIAAVARNLSVELGSEQGFVLCASAPLGAPAGLEDVQMQGRVVQFGDVFSILIENSGPGGLWTELGRTVTVGAPPEDVLADHEIVLHAQRHCVDLLRPGALAAEIWESCNAFLRNEQRPEERRLHCHGQGYDLVERPLIRFDETMGIGSNMNIACHPSYAGRRAFAWLCDGFITRDDRAERLHATPQVVLAV